MFCVSKEEEKTGNHEAPFEAIWKMNGIIKTLVNKILGIKIGVWISPLSIKKGGLRTKLDEDFDMVETFTFGYNMFISPGNRVHYKLNIFYNLPT